LLGGHIFQILCPKSASAPTAPEIFTSEPDEMLVLCAGDQGSSKHQYYQTPSIIMNKSLAIFYESDGYRTNSRRLLGRQAAGEGFLKGVVQHSSLDTLYCYTSAPEKFADFQETIKPWNHRSLNHQWLRSQQPAQLAQAGTFYLPGPGLSQHIWARRYADQRAYSICGVTHTIANDNSMKEIGDFLISPVQPWDALICTTNAVKAATDHLLEGWAEYLAQRTGSRPPVNIQLPVIPLGIDCDFFSSAQSTVRQKMRQALSIPEEDIVVLFVGRLCFYAKAHPVPMYIALEQAAQKTNQKIHLVQAGWFENAQEEADFRQGPPKFCPSVNSIFVDGRQPAIRSDIWACADFFMSLVDNIQETFGLTPLEAMASGLPVIVSDWDGYKESVRDGIDGFKIPTMMSPPGTGMQLAAEYFIDKLSYGSYIAHTAALASIDIPATAAAITKLIEDPELRKKMGENGRRRAREIYDWQVVIRSYERLWEELAIARNVAGMSVPVLNNKSPHPLCDDPLRIYNHYPSEIIDLTTVITIGEMATPEKLALVRQDAMTGFGAERRLPASDVDRILQTVRKNPSITMENLIRSHGDLPAVLLIKTAINLAKFDVLRLQKAESE
jgi:alpha-maltose-1-phosphate synthase